MIEHRPVKPLVIFFQPTIRMSLVFKLFPLPILGPPKALFSIMARLDELKVFTVCHRQRVDVKGGHINNDCREFVVPSEINFVESSAQASFSCGDMNGT